MKSTHVLLLCGVTGLFLLVSQSSRSRDRSAGINVCLLLLWAQVWQKRSTHVECRHCPLVASWKTCTRGGVLSLSLPPPPSPLHVRGLCVAPTPVLGVQERGDLRGVVALQPVLIEGVQGGVDLRQADRQTAVGLLHLLDEVFIRPAAGVALRLAAAAQAPCGHETGSEPQLQDHLAAVLSRWFRALPPGQDSTSTSW